MSEAAEKIMVTCPACARRYLVAPSAVGRQASCKCGTKFTVEAPPPKAADAPWTAPAAASPPEQAAGSVAAAASARARAAPDCVNHPGSAAAFACARCHALICTVCDFPQPDGSHVCPKCVTAPASSGFPGGPFGTAGGVPPYGTPQFGAPAFGPPSFGATPYGAPPYGPPQFGPPGMPASPYASPYSPPSYGAPYGGYAMPQGVKCQWHPENPAVAYCQSCRAPVCATCDFQFPGGIHCCPKCATSNEPRPLSSNRKQLAGWSIALAAGATLALFLVIVISISMAGEPDEELAAFVGFLVIGAMLLSIIGTALGFSSLDKRAGNPPLVWVGTIWNSVITAGWILLMLVGFMAMAAAG